MPSIKKPASGKSGRHSQYSKQFKSNVEDSRNDMTNPEPLDEEEDNFDNERFESERTNRQEPIEEEVEQKIEPKAEPKIEPKIEETKPKSSTSKTNLGTKPMSGMKKNMFERKPEPQSEPPKVQEEPKKKTTKPGELELPEDLFGTDTQEVTQNKNLNKDKDDDEFGLGQSDKKKSGGINLMKGKAGTSKKDMTAQNSNKGSKKGPINLNVQNSQVSDGGIEDLD